ncbi:MAG TPA: 2,3-bisphosphoglycerate-independent phosphoglycerate mutase [Bacilli bacterium]|nr:2,3-bisphosphoglycerate-independent phosphoglycerate mutase [Bacilli bacterium]
MQPVVLCILDGVGIRDNNHGNAFMMAKKPNFDYLFNNYPHSYLKASGEDVGLPHGQMGNSEVGHTNIGAGRVVYQPLELINQAIKNKTFFNNEQILSVIEHVKNNDSCLHIFGLLSDGGIHSHINHLFALIDMAQKNGIKKLYIHAFLDGRDTLPDSAIKYLDMLNDKIKEIPDYKLGTISGRYYAMDRDNRWDRISLAYNAIVYNRGKYNSNYKDAIEESYKNKIYDEFVVPTVIDKNSKVNDNDGLILFNFRKDRGRELFSALSNDNFSSFVTKKFDNIKLVTMMPVNEEVKGLTAYVDPDFKNILGDYLSLNNKKQLRIAETEKYAHVTFFFDGGKEKDIKNCDRILIPSPKVATYDLAPCMSAVEITDKLLEKMDNYDVVILNYANGDMLGHTGMIDKTIESIECLDECLGRLYNKVKELKGTLIVTADHGNCEYMLDDDNNVITSHTTNLVPFIVTKSNITLKDGRLADIAPTILDLLDLKKPEEMNGDSLIK